MDINKDKRLVEEEPEIVEWICHCCGCCFPYDEWERNGGVCPQCGAGGTNLEPLYD